MNNDMESLWKYHTGEIRECSHLKHGEQKYMTLSTLTSVKYTGIRKW